jgi:hypothetical protein
LAQVSLSIIQRIDGEPLLLIENMDWKEQELLSGSIVKEFEECSKRK